MHTFGIWDENPSPTLGGGLVRRPEGEAEGAKRMSTSLFLRQPTPRLRLAGHLLDRRSSRGA